LPQVAARYPKQLSGGQQQRIAIARSVVLEPRVLLFDEPLSNLDFKLRVTMRTELRELQRRLGKTTVYVTHDQGEALALSDRIVVMSNGRIEQIGAPRDIYERPANAFVADFIGNSNLLAATVLSVESDATVVRTAEGLTLRAAPALEPAGAEVVAMIRPEHLRLVSPGDAAPQNRISARIEEAVYLGQDLHLRLRAEGGQALSAVTRGNAAGHHAAGDTVALAVDPTDVFLLRK
jgi:ABC-type Fe3+/spermidine/putrescine transport system ATPase subunit